MQSGKKILIIEDDRNLANLLTVHLQDLGFAATRAENGVTGLQKALADTYTLVILDPVSYTHLRAHET